MAESNEGEGGGERRVATREDIENISKVADSVWEAHLSNTTERAGKCAVIKDQTVGYVRCFIDPRRAITAYMVDAWEMLNTLPRDENRSYEEHLAWDHRATLLVGYAACEYSLKIFENLLPHVLAWSFRIAKSLNLPILMLEASHMSAMKDGDIGVYLRRQIWLSNIEKVKKEWIKTLGGELAQVALATAQELKSSFDLEVLEIYNRTLKACQQIKKEARPFSNTCRRGSKKRDDSAAWETEYAALKPDIPPGIELHSYEFLTKTANEIALRAVADFFNIHQTTLKTRILPELRKRNPRKP
jgi:hypothetical protein